MQQNLLEIVGKKHSYTLFKEVRSITHHEKAPLYTINPVNTDNTKAHTQTIDH